MEKDGRLLLGDQAIGRIMKEADNLTTMMGADWELLQMLGLDQYLDQVRKMYNGYSAGTGLKLCCCFFLKGGSVFRVL